MLKGIRDEGEVTRKFMEARCDRGAEIARMLFLSEETAGAIRSLDEHWDGRGMPDGLCGEEIPLAARILCLAQTVEVFHAARGLKAARTMALAPAGAVVRPGAGRRVSALLRRPGLLGRARGARRFGVGAAGLRARRRRRPPRPDRRGVRASDRRQVAVHRQPLAASRRDRRRDRRRARVHAEERRTLLRAALLHDIGKLAISSRILDKPDKLTDEEFRAIQTHPVHTLRILERAPCFASLADLAANHHEKLDGSGYPRSLDARHLDLPMRVLAVADVYEALTADRPYRGPLPVEEALAIINRDVPHKLDADALGALEVHVGRSDVSAGPAGLTLSEA